MEKNVTEMELVEMCENKKYKIIELTVTNPKEKAKNIQGNEIYNR